MAKRPHQNCHLWFQVGTTAGTLGLKFCQCRWLAKRFFLLSTRSSSSVLMNLMMSDENNRDIYITIASMPPSQPCSKCCPLPSATTIRTGEPPRTRSLLLLLPPPPSCVNPSVSRRKWRVPRTRVRAEQQVPGGVPVPHVSASFPAEEGPGRPVEH